MNSNLISRKYIRFNPVIFKCLFVLMILCGPICAFEYTGKPVVDIRVESKSDEISGFVLGMFSDIRNKPLSYSKIGFLIEALQKNENVESVDIIVRPDKNPRGVLVLVKVRIKFRVEKLSFTGNRFFSDYRLTSKVAIAKNELLDYSDLREASQNIKKAYSERGFFQTKVNYEKIFIDGDIGGTLRFNIREGNRSIVDDILIVGDLRNKKPQDIIKKLSIKKLSPFDKPYLDKRVAVLRKKLTNEGYRLVSIIEPIVDYNPQTNKTTLVIKMDIGPKIQISFKGNHYFFERTGVLKEEIRLEQENKFSQSWVQTAKYELERFYKSLGYALVKISSTDKLSDDGNERKITFKIKKGRRVKIKKVIFRGNKAFDSEFLEDKFLDFDFKALRNGMYFHEDIRNAYKSLIRFYHTRGYLKAERVGEPAVTFNKGKNRAIIEISISEGEQYFMGNFDIKGNAMFSDREIREFLEVDKGEPFDPYKIEDNLDKLITYYKEKGYKQARIYSLQKIDINKVDLKIFVSEGERLKIGSIKIKGNKTTDENLIRREFLIKEGDFYNPKKIAQSENNVARLGLFSSVFLKEVNYDVLEKTIDLILVVSEKKKRSIKTRIGYGSDEGLRSGVDITVINMGGRGRTLALGGQLSHRLKSNKILRRKETVSYREPRLFGSKIDGKIGVIDEREEEPQFNIDRTAFAIGVDTAFSKVVRNSVTYNIEYRKPFDLKVAEEDLSPFDEARKRLGYFDITLEFDGRDNLFNARKGYLLEMIFDTYNKNLWSEANFLQAYSRSSLYIPIWKRIRAIVAVKFGFSSTYGSTRNEGIQIPIEKRFRLGGSNSLRGFSRNSVGGLSSDQPAVGSSDSDDQAPGGNSFFNYNLELIMPLVFNFDFVVFTDGGEAWKANKDFNPLDIRNTAGFGLRYNTPVGPLRIDIGFILDRRTGENWGEIQFAIGLL